LPFSALQFAFYEQFKRWSTSITRQLEGSQKSMSNNIPWEMVNGAAAGGLAGFLTTPLGCSINARRILWGRCCEDPNTDRHSQFSNKNHPPPFGFDTSCCWILCSPKKSSDGISGHGIATCLHA
jgi:hypothetical protein